MWFGAVSCVDIHINAGTVPGNEKVRKIIFRSFSTYNLVHCCGSVCFWLFTESDHQAEIVRKTFIPTVSLILNDFLSLKNHVNVPSKSAVLNATDQNSRSWILICYLSVQKLHGSATLVICDFCN
jgi:hypothetical protein